MSLLVAFVFNWIQEDDANFDFLSKGFKRNNIGILISAFFYFSHEGNKRRYYKGYALVDLFNTEKLSKKLIPNFGEDGKGLHRFYLHPNNSSDYWKYFVAYIADKYLWKKVVTIVNQEKSTEQFSRPLVLKNNHINNCNIKTYSKVPTDETVKKMVKNLVNPWKHKMSKRVFYFPTDIESKYIW